MRDILKIEVKAKDNISASTETTDQLERNCRLLQTLFSLNVCVYLLFVLISLFVCLFECVCVCFNEIVCVCFNEIVCVCLLNMFV